MRNTLDDITLVMMFGITFALFGIWVNLRKKNKNQDRLSLDSRIAFFKALDEIDWTEHQEDRDHLVQMVDRMRQDSFEAGRLEERKNRLEAIR